MSKLALLILVVAALLVGCTVPSINSLTGSGNPMTQTYDFTDFTAVNISHAFQAEITQGDEYFVEVTVDDNLADRLKVEQSGDTVYIGLEPTLLTDDVTLRARITMPTLTRVDASGASKAKLSDFSSSESLRFDISGASVVEGDIDASDTRADISGASRIELAGSADNLDLTVSGASKAELYDFVVTNANVNASGGSHASVHVTGTLDADASGASTVRYDGDPTLGNTSTSGAGSIKPR